MIRKELEQGADLENILDRLRHRIAMRIPLTEPTETRVRIMTFYGAKGLEADVVIIAGAADQIIPGRLPDGSPRREERREEQRRLLYVSVTRAKHELIISRSKSMPYSDASKNQVRLDGGVVHVGRQKVVKLGRMHLLPNIQHEPQTGRTRFRSKSGK